MDRSIKMKWFLCNVIFLHRWWERWEIWCFCSNHPLLDGGIKARLLLAKIKSLICDVVTDYHLIPRKRNRTSYPQERIFALKFTRVLTHRKCFSWKKQDILSSCNNDSIIYRFINEAELMIIKSTGRFVM